MSLSLGSDIEYRYKQLLNRFTNLFVSRGCPLISFLYFFRIIIFKNFTLMYEVTIFLHPLSETNIQRQHE